MILWDALVWAFEVWLHVVALAACPCFLLPLGLMAGAFLLDLLRGRL